MQRLRVAKLGFGTAIVGFLIACLSLIPSIGKTSMIPWPLFVGSFVYLAGALALALNARGPEGKKALLWLRMVRMGFPLIFFLVLAHYGPPR